MGLAFALSMQVAAAKVELPGIIGNDMVLQRNSETVLWGKAQPFSKVKVKASWLENAVSAKADADGKWSVKVKTTDAGGPYTIEFNDGDRLVLDNVMMGDVWFCSGQSNMEMPMKGFTSQPVEGSSADIVSAKPEVPVRICQVTKTAALVPQEECQAVWQTHTPENVANTSAVAYYFAKRIYDTVEIPVGIIVSCWGGTPIQAWMDKETVSVFPDFDLSFIEKGELPEKPKYSPATLFNAMVAPLTDFAVKGFLWYQGEANIDKAGIYTELQRKYVEMMRKYWHNDTLPFYFVQIAPYKYEGEDGVSAAFLRDAQTASLNVIPYSGMAVTMDVGDAGCIHPAKKKEVGDRLAYLALTNDYGIKGLDPYSPVFQSWKADGSKAVVKFKVGAMGLAPRGHFVDGFELAGEDRVFYPAKARISRAEGGSLVEVSCEQVTAPVAVRYGFRNVIKSTLSNCSGMPAAPFSSDK